MTVHVGISPNWEEISYYNETEKKLFHSPLTAVKPHQIENVNLVYDEIISRINAKPGYLCICLDDTYGDKIRKKFMEKGLKNGFKKVEIINWETALYLNALSQIPYEPRNNDIIWIHWLQHFYVWLKSDQKAKFIGKWEYNAPPNICKNKIQ